VIKLHESENKPAVSADCFVIMPIADPDGYDKGHFTKVYEDIFKPACISAGFTAVRANEVEQTNLIHLDILQKLIESPMVICDLSSRNPNVLFELGLRQAFDKPTVLVQEAGTPKIFDIAPLRYTEYRRALRYREVLEDQSMISAAIKATKESTDRGEGVNSIINILSLSKPASLKEVSDDNPAGLLQFVRAEISEMRSDFQRIMYIMERDREHINFSDGRLYSYPHLPEMLGIYREIEALSTRNNIPGEVIFSKIEKARKQLAPIIDSAHTTPEYLNEAKRILSMFERLERKLFSGLKKI